MNVLVTRPDYRGQQLVEMLRVHHIFAIHQPLFRIEAGDELPNFPAQLSALNAGDYLFPVSKSAVDFAHQTLIETGFRWRSDLRYLAVGESTANYLASKSEQAVRYPLHSASSEGLLNLSELQDLTNKSVLVLRADTGRELFAQQAQLRGAEIRTIECYRRLPLKENLGEKISLAKRAGIDTIVATSNEILTSLRKNTLESDHPWLLGCNLIVVSKRIAQSAIQLGWQPNCIHISEKADNSSLLKTILGILTLDKVGNYG
ncbi:uroporphyrinogen-III synthase [Vespertiliibacter pulmonis]|uniref:Uroporphyrinogen-III synthase n=1 Tax=Vespertiliibacter pulmonis TaxID=1443036 RepID=A0A3N4WIC2_9PAST|nr:uroporphyrinogen-III synthase [Vespertiliibacter pulmonis]QLB21274.1 uroporphyrinogen-III synthase [Vespertiliibacter pulmonis]RPE85680.1 uroporphyrinogen-III synthase [Vespertiliibacter pulmonis]